MCVCVCVRAVSPRWALQCSSVTLFDVYFAAGSFLFGTVAVRAHSAVAAPAHKRPCVVGCLLDMDATPARMTVFVDGEPLAVQCEYDFPKDGRAWFPSVALYRNSTLHSCAM